MRLIQLVPYNIINIRLKLNGNGCPEPVFKPSEYADLAKTRRTGEFDEDEVEKQHYNVLQRKRLCANVKTWL